MITNWKKDEFKEYVIAQHDDCDYQESGFLALVKGEEAALTNYGHCPIGE